MEETFFEYSAFRESHVQCIFDLPPHDPPIPTLDTCLFILYISVLYYAIYYFSLGPLLVLGWLYCFVYVYSG